MISKANEKYIKSLKDKKHRSEAGAFVVEGNKMVKELITAGWNIQSLFATTEWVNENEELLSPLQNKITVAAEFEIKKISSLLTPSPVVAVAEIKSFTVNEATINNSLSLVLDEIQDPGNMGTIIRTADWFGIQYVFISENSADIYNHKVIQATMGSLFHINIIRADVEELLKNHSAIKVYGAVLQGENIFEAVLTEPAFILIGNESRGINENLIPFIHRRISIPSLGKAESLNAAVAAGIICSRFRNS